MIWLFDGNWDENGSFLNFQKMHSFCSKCNIEHGIYSCTYRPHDAVPWWALRHNCPFMLSFQLAIVTHLKNLIGYDVAAAVQS